jgi:hypothetical protein
MLCCRHVRTVPPAVRRRLAAAALALLAIAVAARCLRPDEMLCEEAVARLSSCCPGFDPGSMRCVYSEGCGTTYPDLSEPDARCIAGASCAQLVANGICTRAPGSTVTDPNAGATLCR